MQITVAAGLLFVLAACTAVLLLTSGTGLPRPTLVHLVVAVGALPLMWAALLHFIPVLTRSRDPAPWLRLLPWLGAASGVGVVFSLSQILPRNTLQFMALCAASGAVTLLFWLVQRIRQCLGKPHPGIYWYIASLGALIIALLSVFGITTFGEYPLAAYRLHLHLNLFGWIGLTVLGTAPVLMATIHGRFDPLTSSLLLRTVPAGIGGALLLASGAALSMPWIALVGASLLLVVQGLFIRQWRQLFGAPMLWPGTAVSLFLGQIGLAIVMMAGTAHGLKISGAPNANALLPAFLCAFLLPTVLGALAQLLPVWRHPGPTSPARQILTKKLAHGAAVRGILAFTGGIGALLEIPYAIGLAGLSLAAMLLAMMPPKKCHPTKP